VRPPVFITTSWDDGHPSDLRLADLLDKYGLPGTFYVPLENSRPVLEDRQILHLSSRFEIGAHTVNHTDLITAPDEVTRREIVDSRMRLEHICARPCHAFCFPKGRFRRKHVEFVRMAGYRTARTVELMSLEAPRLQDGVAMMPTTVQAGPMAFSKMARNSLKRLRPANLFRHVCHARADWVATAESVLDHAMNRGGVFHLWGHSWEIEEMNEWKNLERVFALLSHCRGRAMFVDNTGLARATLS
jgi:peptidoglycan/xylan/chitin deacetylase (PgdA/CDA1 family)